MKLGPVVMMKNATFSRLLSTQTLLAEENSRLSAELGVGTTTHSFMHYPWTANTAASVILPADKDNALVDQAVGRVIDAYQLALKEYENPAPCMWDEIEQGHQDFISNLAKGKHQEVKAVLASMFQSDIIWGLGKFDQALVADMVQVRDKSHVQLRITDALVSIAQAVAELPITSVEQQGVEGHLQALKVDLRAVLRDVEQQSGLDLSSPRVGASYGCEIEGRFFTIDSIINSYTLYRAAQLGAKVNSNIVEIGGGFGCLAELFYRAGYSNYAVYDLPWVNALQGYYLIMSTNPESVRLLGESRGHIKVNPFWHFDDIPSKSIDFLINTDSLPEMGKDTAFHYLKQGLGVLRGLFISINQEAQANNAQVGCQNRVSDLVRQAGGYRTLSRSIYWMRQGYVEEVFAPMAGSGV